MAGARHLEAQRTALFAFCKRIVADAETREIVIETDVTGMAQDQAVPGLPSELCNFDLPEGEYAAIAQPGWSILMPWLRFRAA